MMLMVSWRHGSIVLATHLLAPTDMPIHPLTVFFRLGVADDASTNMPTLNVRLSAADELRELIVRHYHSQTSHHDHSMISPSLIHEKELQ